MTKPMMARPDFAEWVRERIPAGRVGQPQGVAAAAVLVAPPAASLMTGDESSSGWRLDGAGGNGNPDGRGAVERWRQQGLYSHTLRVDRHCRVALFSNRFRRATVVRLGGVALHRGDRDVLCAAASAAVSSRKERTNTMGSFNLRLQI